MKLSRYETIERLDPVKKAELLHKKRKNQKKHLLIVLSTVFMLVFMLCILGYYQMCVRVGVISDEEMIQNFYENRQDIEELVTSFRYFEPKLAEGEQHFTGWEKLTDTKIRMARANVYDIGNRIPSWYPEPYSQDAEQRRYENGYPSFNDRFKYDTIEVSFLPIEKYTTFKILHFHIWKSLVYIPVIPRIENGVLLGPVSIQGKYGKSYYVLDSLDSIPSFWKAFDPYYNNNSCAVRQIEPQWFLMLCHGG